MRLGDGTATPLTIAWNGISAPTAIFNAYTEDHKVRIQNFGQNLGVGAIFIPASTAVDATACYFANTNLAGVGSITTTATTTSFNTSSDYRLKENVAPMTDAVSRLSALKPSRFNFIGSQQTVDGFLAHEAAEVVPECVTGTKDALNDDGSPNYQGIDQAKLVPLLVAAIQEQQAAIVALEARLDALS